MKRKLKCLIIGIKCLFGHHTEDPYVHIIYGNKKDASWIDDIAIMAREEHSQWHREHPDFCAVDNIV